MGYNRSHLGKLMETIQAVARGQKIMAKMQEEMNHRAHAGNPIPTANPPLPPVVENTQILPQINPPLQIGASVGVPPTTLNPPTIEVDDPHESISRPRVASLYEALGPTTNEVENKVKAIKEKLKEMESVDALGLDAAGMCLVPDMVILSKFKVPDFEKYKGISYARTHISAYYRKMAAYSHDDRLLMHFFQDSISGASLI